VAVASAPAVTVRIAGTRLPASRCIAAAASPAIAGALFEAGYEAWPLIICGVLKIIYDFTLLWNLRHIKPPEEQ